MKITIVTIFIVLLISFGVWQTDVAKDQRKRIVVSGKVTAYDKWECGSSLYKDCVEVFTLNPSTEHNVQRIRYGKDYMAIKVNKNNLSGWVTLGKNVKVIGQSGT
jgi:hypothetical protein